MRNSVIRRILFVHMKSASFASHAISLRTIQTLLLLSRSSKWPKRDKTQGIRSINAINQRKRDYSKSWRGSPCTIAENNTLWPYVNNGNPISHGGVNFGFVRTHSVVFVSGLGSGYIPPLGQYSWRARVVMFIREQTGFLVLVLVEQTCSQIRGPARD